MVLSWSLLLAVILVHGAEGKPLAVGTEQQAYNKLLVISFDGFRWNYDQDVETPNLDYLVQNGGLRTGSFHYPGGGANYSGQSVYRSLVESQSHPDGNETEWRENIEIVMNWFTKEKFDFVTLYYGEPDNVGHRSGPETEERRAVIRQIDRTIGFLLEAIERHNLKDSLNVIITSDHGMTTIKKAPQVEEIKLSNYVALRKLVSFDLLDYGGFGMIKPKPGKEEEL
ncbi:UNVERIFIED_CONTAM: hypothetical protein FKN15_007521 [Acipenser sinensis]